MSSNLRIAQRRAVDGYGVAVVPHATQQRFHHGFITEEVLPFVIDQVGRNDRGVTMVALLHRKRKAGCILVNADN